MSNPVFTIEKVHPRAVVPTRGTKGSAGYDLYAVSDVLLPPMTKAKIPLGFKSQFPDGWVAQFFDRSSMASRGLLVAAGTVDSDYRGEWSLLLWNLGDREYLVQSGDRVAQFLILPVIGVSLGEGVVEPSQRGEGGFGSTGR